MKALFSITVLTAFAFGDVTSPKVVYTTFAGTGRNSMFHALAVDYAGFAYVGGSGPAPDGSQCAFITKLNQAGSAAVWSVCLPGLTEVDGLALDSAGNIYAIGSALRVVGGSAQYDPTTVMKLAPDAKTIVYATQVAGVFAEALALDSAGSVYIAGVARGLQATPGAYTVPQAGTFTGKLDAVGSVVYVAGLDMIRVGGVAVDSKGQPWVAGWSCGGLDGLGGCINKFGTALAVRQLDATGASLLVTKTYGGGPSQVNPQIGYGDTASAVAIDPRDDSAWVTGWIQSRTVPTTPDALEPKVPLGDYVAYAIKFSNLGGVLYGSYLGLRAGAPTAAIAVDELGSPYFGLINGPGSSTLVALAADGSSVLLSKDYGSWVQALALDGNGGIYTGGAPISNFMRDVCPTTPGAYQPEAQSASTVVCVARFDMAQTAAAEIFYPLNAGSVQASPVAPGELVTMSGMNLPDNPAVTFDGLPAPIVSADPSKITVVVPFGVNSSWTSLTLDGVGGYVVGVEPTAPGLFTADGTGSGQLDARNQDGSINSTDNPAAAGSTVSIFMTGAGAMLPALADGQLGPTDPPFPAPVQPIYATINGAPANVVLAAQAPGKIAGIVRLDIQIPDGTASGNALIKIGLGNSDPASFPWQPRTTIAIQ